MCEAYEVEGTNIEVLVEEIPTTQSGGGCSSSLFEPTVAEVIKGKRIILWKEMLQAIQYSDVGVVDEFVKCSGLPPRRFGLQSLPQPR